MNDEPEAQSELHANLRLEYQAAQSSAEHHDRLFWSASAVIWAASLVLMGLVIDKLDRSELRGILTYIAAIGIALNVYLALTSLLCRSIKNQKYQRCKDIEIALRDLKQHRELKYLPHAHTAIYFIMLGAIITFWIIVLCRLWCC